MMKRERRMKKKTSPWLRFWRRFWRKQERIVRTETVAGVDYTSEYDLP